MLKTEELRIIGMKWLARREHSIHEFREKFLKKFPDQTESIEEIIQEFCEKNWLSDERFSEAFIHDQVLLVSAGPYKILQKLRQKGIEEMLAKQMLQKHFSLSEQLEKGRVLAQRKQQDIRARKKDLTDIEVRQKIYQFLLQKGFESDIIKKVLDQ